MADEGKPYPDDIAFRVAKRVVVAKKPKVESEADLQVYENVPAVPDVVAGVLNLYLPDGLLLIPMSRLWELEYPRGLLYDFGAAAQRHTFFKMKEQLEQARGE